jgi:hypothetical protein
MYGAPLISQQLTKRKSVRGSDPNVSGDMSSGRQSDISGMALMARAYNQAQKFGVEPAAHRAEGGVGSRGRQSKLNSASR